MKFAGRAAFGPFAATGFVFVVTAWLTQGATGQIVLTDANPFYRFVEGVDAEQPHREIKFKAGLEYRNALRGAMAYRSGKTVVPVGEDNTFRVGDLVDSNELSKDSLGLVIATDSNFGRRHTYLSFTDIGGRANLDDHRISALPNHIVGAQGRFFQEVDAWAGEALALPNEYRTGAVHVPEGAHLSFGIATENMLQDARARSVAFLGLDDGKKTPSLRFSIFAESGGEKFALYSRVIGVEDFEQVEGRWIDENLDLGSLADKTVNFVFSIDGTGQTSEGLPGAAFGFGAWGSPMIYMTEPRVESQKPNVLMISLDTLRADHLGSYGYGRDTSPNIDRFAEEAHLFENCISTSSWTTPAHASIFTGLPMSLHRAGTRATFRVAETLDMTAEIARAQGYLTAAFTQGVAVSGASGFNQGFELYSDNVAKVAAGDADGGVRSRRAERVFEQGMRWLDDFGDLPFFLFLHTYEIHTPYAPPETFARKFTSAKSIRAEPEFVTTSAAERQRVIDLYDAGIAYTDHALQGLFEYLGDKGLLENTIVILFSDHGEEFWEHGGITHAYTLYQEVLHVPLIIRMPGASRPGSRIPKYVSLSDLFATVLDLTELEGVRPVDSISLLPFLSSKPDPGAYGRTSVRSELYKMLEDYYLISSIDDSFKYTARTEYGRRDSPMHLSRGNEEERLRAGDEIALMNFLINVQQRLASGLSDQESKLLLKAATETLYNLERDPGEKDVLTSAESDRVEAFRRALLAELRAGVEDAKLRSIEASEVAPLTEEEIQELEAMGYLQ